MKLNEILTLTFDESTFSESTMSRTQVKFWCNPFKESREDVNDDASLGLPSTSTTDENIDTVTKKCSNNLRIPIREVADDVSRSFGVCQIIFTYVLSIKRAAAQVVPKLQDFEQKQCRMDIFQELSTTFNDDVCTERS